EMPDRSLYNRTNFADNALLKKLREEWRAAHPHYSYKTTKHGMVRQRSRAKPKPAPAKPVNTKRKRTTSDPGIKMYEGLFDDFRPEAVNTKLSKPSSDRTRDRHSPGYMREYMRRRRAAQK